MRLPALTATALFCTVLPATAAYAGVYLESSDKDLIGVDKPAITKMWFDGGRMRTERMEPDGDSQIAIFRDQAMYTLDPKSKSYRVIDKATADRLGGQIADARKKMEARMANMPPEQRKRMAEMMEKMGGGAGAMPGAKPPERTLRNTGRTETVAGIKCTVWEAIEEGEKEQELCAAAPASIPGGEDVMKTFREISTMLSSFSQSIGGDRNGDEPWRDMDKINGVPILTREFSDGKAHSEMRLMVARKESVPGSSFEVPPGYTEKKMNFGPGGQ
jgi:hypothetical protein